MINYKKYIVLVAFCLYSISCFSMEHNKKQISYWELDFNTINDDVIDQLFSGHLACLRNNACAKDNDYVKVFNELKGLNDFAMISELYRKLNKSNSVDIRKKEILACRAYEQFGEKKLLDDFMDNYLIYPNRISLTLPFYDTHILLYKEKDKKWLFNCYKKILRNATISIMNINKLGLNGYIDSIEHYNECINISISAMVAMKKQLKLDQSLVVMIDDEITNYLEFYTFFPYQPNYFEKLAAKKNYFFFKDGIALSKQEIMNYEKKIFEKTQKKLLNDELDVRK